MKLLEHRTQNQTVANPERIGFLIELHCVLKPVLHRCSSYGTYRGTVRYGSSWPVPLVQLNAAGVCIGISESPAALSDDTHLPPIDERRGITSAARNQPLTPFLDTISPGFGVLLR